MPTNVTPHYQKAEQEYHEAKTTQQKILALKKMLTLVPKHKGTESLQSNIKQRIAKLKYTKEREEKHTKGKRSGLSIKKEGAAQVVLIGKTNSGKSYLLSKLTNAKPLVADYEFTTKMPEIGIMDYSGVLIQIVEIPAITEDFIEKEKGPMFLGLVRNADLVVIVGDSKEDVSFVKKELSNADIDFKGVVVSSKEDVGSVKDAIWKSLGLIYVYTKSPGKKKDYPPVALDVGSSVRDLASHVHKDFIKKFDFARVWGKSAKFDSQRVGLNHVLEEGDVVELHLK